MDTRNRIAPAIHQGVSPASPTRRAIAVGILGRTAGRTVSIIRTADGVTGTVYSRCPKCKHLFEDCTCTGVAR